MSLNAMLTDEDLTRLLGQTAEEFEVPAVELDRPVEEARPLWRRRGPQVGAAAAALVVGVLLVQSSLPHAATNKSTSASSSSSAPHRSADTLGPVAAPGQPAPTALTYGRSKTVAGTSASAAEPDGARIVKTGTITLEVDEGKVSATVQRLGVIVAGARGYVSDSTSQELSDHPTATVTVRVPERSFETVIQQVRGMKATVVSAETSGKDVTAAYADTQAQIQSLKAARNRYLAILAGAKTIAETLTVQQRVDDVQGQIDRLEGQRRVLADQSDLATLTVSVGEHGAQVLVTKQNAWSKAWHDATHGFTSGIQSMIAHSGRTLLVLLVGATLLLLARAGWRFARRRLV